MAQIPTMATFSTPLGPQPHGKFYSPHEVVLALKEKVFSLSGDDFTVRTAEGQDVLKVKGKWISLRQTKKFTDMADNEIFQLSNKMMSIHKSFSAVSPDGAHDFEVSGKFKLMGSKSVVTFKNAADGKPVELEVKGDWFDRSAEITCTYLERCLSLEPHADYSAHSFSGRQASSEGFEEVLQCEGVLW